MANEFGHLPDVGTVLAESEYDSLTGHRFNSQATGDMMIATSAAQLSRLAAGTQGHPLVMGASLPQWGGGMLMDGAIDMNSEDLNNVDRIYSPVDGGLYVYGRRQDHDIAFVLYTSGVSPGYADTQRLSIEGRAAEVEATWSNVKHIGFKLSSTFDANANRIEKLTYLDGTSSSDLTLRGNASSGDATERNILFQVLDAVNDVRITVLTCVANGAAPYLRANRDLAFNTSIDSVLVADEVSLGGYDIAPGQRSLAISQENPIVTEAIGASDRTWPVRINGATYKILLVAV